MAEKTQTHTPGAYETASLPGDYFGEPPCIAIVGPLPDRLIIAKVFGRESQASADAQLFVAASDLLESLEEVVRISDRKHDAWDKARAAIAKAKGDR